MNDDLEDGECPGCGSSLTDRTHRAHANSDPTSTALKECPHCGTLKCCMCDMGDDVECISCDKGDDE
jgi:hypothetical protein